MEKQRGLLALIFVLAIGAVVVLASLGLQLGLDLKGGAQLTIQVQPTKEVTQINSEDLNAVKTVIENRINALGVAEPVIQTVGNDKVLVQLPGVTDSEQAERVLGGTAQLEFRQQKSGTEGQFQAEYAVNQQIKAQLAELKKPGKDKNLNEIGKLNQTLQESNAAILKLFDSIGLIGKNLKDARPSPTQAGNSWEVAIRFDDEGGKKFAQLTKNVAGTGRALGIFLDDSLISAPVVGVEFAAAGITGGSAVITGNFTVESANELAVQLRGGSLPFPVAVVENRTVGATLGQDSIRSSIIAGISGLILVLIFIGVYYRLPGIIADLALLIYTLLTLAAYALIGVTMTLPGIAGFILSIGMAVDANVLIFERTREELRAGNTLYRSVESGFYRAFSSILDSNVTTLIACAALFWLGSGLVKGFALTLAIGVGISMFTALTCSRTLMLAVVLGYPGIRQKPQLFCPNLPVRD
jgi:preprotein translocase subunit SecD